MTTVKAVVVIIVLVYFLSFSLPNGRAQYQGQALNDTENVNVTSSDEAVSEQTNVPSNNQTISTTNGVNGTSINVTSSETPNNELQEQLQPQQQERSTLLQQQQQPVAPPSSPPPQQQTLPPPITQSSPQQPLYCYYPNYNPQCVGGQTIPISIVPGAATQLNQAFQPGLLYVDVGTRITWNNFDSQIHTVTSGSGVMDKSLNQVS